MSVVVFLCNRNNVADHAPPPRRMSSVMRYEPMAEVGAAKTGDERPELGRLE